MGLELFRHFNLIEQFNIDEAKLKNFLNSIEAGYHSHNPYHNNTHAADVVCSGFLSTCSLPPPCASLPLGPVLTTVTFPLSRSGTNCCVFHQARRTG